MKSNLFSKNNLLRDEEFSKDLKILIELNPETIANLSNFSYEYSISSIGKERNSIRDSASESLDVPRSQLDYVLRISNYFINEFISKGDAEDDNPEDIVEDIYSLIDVPDSIKGSLVEYLKQIKKLAKEKAEVAIQKKQHTKSSLSNLDSISCVIDYRVVFDKYLGFNEDVDEFKPNCIGAIPIVIVELGLKKRDQEDKVNFQVDRKVLKILIDHLRSIDKQMDIAQDHFKLTEYNKNGTDR